MSSLAAFTSHPLVGWLAVLMAAATGTACRAERTPAAVQPPPLAARLSWDPARAEVLQWQADDAVFAQDRAIEASGLALSSRHLYVVAEKYADRIESMYKE